MRKISAIACAVLKMFFRNGTASGLMIALAALSIFIFAFARSDGEIINELRIRVRYSFFFFYGLLSLSIMYLACITLRKDIEGRQFHSLASAPVHRAQIWLGKFLGVLAFAMLCFVFSSIVTGICAAIYIGVRHDQKDFSAVREKFLRAYSQKIPIVEPVERQIDDRFRKMQAEGALPAGSTENEIRRQLRDDIRRDEQMLGPDGEKKWRFEWNPAAAARFSDHIVLRIKFYAEQKRQIIVGKLSIASSDSSQRWEEDFSGYPYTYHEFRIPLSKVPKSRMLTLSFKGKGTPYLIFPIDNGVSLFHDNGGLLGNYFRMASVIFLNLMVLTAVGLSAASLFTYTVSVFVSLVIYLVGVSADFFLGVIRELGYGWHGADQSSVYLLSGFIKLGLWLTGGIKCPPVIETFTENISIPLEQILLGWGAQTLIYAAAIAVLGIVVLTLKEIDKLMGA